MATRFERDIKFPSCCIAGLLESGHFGMGTPNWCGCPGSATSPLAATTTPTRIRARTY